MLKGRCLCGAVSFEIQGPARAPSLCHCSQCRRIHGAPGAYTSAPASAYRIHGEESLNWHPTSNRAAQGFCKVCGAKLFWREIGGTELDAAMGSLAAPTGLKLAIHIWTRSQGDYYAIGHDGVPRFAEASRDAEPIGEEAPPQPGPRRTEHSGRCECGAVSFRVSGNMRDVVHCHCDQCRRIHGHAPGYSAARQAEMRIEGEDDITWYRAPGEAQRGFCRRCGSSLFWRSDGRDTISISAGSINPPSGLRTARHIFAADKGDYYEIADGLPQDAAGMSDNPVTF